MEVDGTYSKTTFGTVYGCQKFRPVPECCTCRKNGAEARAVLENSTVLFSVTSITPTSISLLQPLD